MQQLPTRRGRLCFASEQASEVCFMHFCEEKVLSENRSARERMEREQRDQNLRISSFSADVQDCIRSVELESAPEEVTRNSATARDPTMEHSQSTSEMQLAPHGMSISEHPLAEILPASSITPSQDHISLPLPTSSRTKSWIQISSPLASAPVSQTSLSGIPKLPKIFAPFPRHLDTHDLTYLHSRGALILPTEPLQIALLKAYVEFVHPNFPLLDLEEFLSIVKYGFAGLEDEKGKGVERESAGKKHISFLLFQAVMFAAVEFVGLKSLKEAGYKSKRGAKVALFARVRVRSSKSERAF